MSRDDNIEARLARIAASFFSSYWRWELQATEMLEATVEAELAKRLPHIAVSSWPARFELGGVYVAGAPATLGLQLIAPCRLEYYEPRMSVERVADFYPRFSSEMILFIDPDCAVVFKPAGLPTTPARDQQRYSMQRYLEQHLDQAVHMPSRLDTAVSGVALCSLSTRMNRYLQKAYDSRWIEKRYLAEVVGMPSWSTKSCEQAIERDPRHPVLRRCASTGGESARTRFFRVDSSERGGAVRTLLQAEPLTGRTHQIRVHCLYEGFPIVGDPYYDGIDDRELHLLSYGVKFFHPFRQEHVAVFTPANSLPEWLSGYELPT